MPKNLCLRCDARDPKSTVTEKGMSVYRDRRIGRIAYPDRAVSGPSRIWPRLGARLGVSTGTITVAWDCKVLQDTNPSGLRLNIPCITYLNRLGGWRLSQGLSPRLDRASGLGLIVFPGPRSHCRTISVLSIILH